MNLNQIAVPSTDVARAAEFYRTLGLIQIVDARPDYARFECPDGDGTLSVERVDKVARGHGVVVYFECDDLDEWVRALELAGCAVTWAESPRAPCPRNPAVLVDQPAEPIPPLHPAGRTSDHVYDSSGRW